jgi:hypothetical protein
MIAWIAKVNESMIAWIAELKEPLITVMIVYQIV